MLKKRGGTTGGASARLDPVPHNSLRFFASDQVKSVGQVCEHVGDRQAAAGLVCEAEGGRPAGGGST